MEKNRIEMYNGMVWGIKVSDRGLESGYLDYRTLSEMVGACILNNTVREETPYGWEVVNGDLNGVIDIVDGDVVTTIHQEYLISRRGYQILADYTDEIVFYNDQLELYIWAIDHYGTSWDYVLTDVKLIEEGEM